MSSGFVHLHCHTEYSVLDGQCKVQELMEKCHEFNMNSCAITDHGVLFGAVEFYKAAKKANIKPIIGSELYVAQGDRHTKGGRSGNYYHFLMLCKDLQGYRNLCKLSTLGFLEGFHYKPRVDDELLAKYSEGLITTSSCLAGEVPQHLMNGDMDAANAAVEKFIAMFGKDNFIIELMDHGMEEQHKVNPLLAELADKHDLMMIATNDCHYINKEDAAPHEALLCIQTNGLLDEEDHFKFPTDEVYFRSPDEMREVFTRWPEAVSNTEKVAERCNLELPLGEHLIPQFVPPEGITQTDYLESLVHQGIVERYGENPADKYVARAKYELEVIEKMGFVDYFLVTWDLINYAREQSIPVGPGRGSGAGSIVAYALMITNIDPMMYDLLFERFLNPERVSMPDFDIDFCYVRREEMIEYTRKKYGEDNVSQIITFGRMLAKNVVRNVGRVLGMPYGDVDRIAKMIPDELGIKLEQAYEREPQLKRLIAANAQVGRLWKIALRLEGTIGNCGTHAAGVVICDQPLTDHVALYRAAGQDSAVATQVEMKGIEEVGLLKMDFLGLRTLTVIHEAVRLVRENHGVEIDIDNIDTNDEKAYALLRSGKTTGIFQLESSGMRDVARRIGLQSLEEVCALVALYRPGPMQFIDTYIENKHHPEKIKYDHPLLEPILGATYGIAVYQEQVMQIVQAIAGFSLGQADIVRRAMGKKDVGLLEKQEADFIEGAKRLHQIDKKLAHTLWQTIYTFAGYGFNKSHSIAYAFVAYQTAYLKAHYPHEFMASLLTSESGNLDKTAMYVEECRLMGIKVRQPDVNKSHLHFAVDGEAIHFGLVAIKHIGEGPAKAIVEAREADGDFEDIYDFCSRVESRTANKRLIESLNYAGGFESTGWTRAEVDASVEPAMNEAQLGQRDRDAGQTSLLELMGNEETSATIHDKPKVKDWSEGDRLSAEKEVLGLFVSSHPLDNYREILHQYSCKSLDDLPNMKDDDEMMIGGMISAVKIHITAKSQKTMAFITLDTLAGPCEVTVFSDTYERRQQLIVQDSIVMIPAHVNLRNGEAGLIADDVVAIQDTQSRLTKAMHVRVDGNGESHEKVRQLAQILGAAPGTCEVRLHCFTSEGDAVEILATNACQVAPSEELLKGVESLMGPGATWFEGTHTSRQPEAAQSA